MLIVLAVSSVLEGGCDEDSPDPPEIFESFEVINLFY